MNFLVISLAALLILEAIPNLERARRKLAQVSLSFRNRVPKLSSAVSDFERNLESVREDVSQLLVRYRSKLNDAFVENSLARTHYRWTNQIIQIIQNPAPFTELELEMFNLSKPFKTLELYEHNTSPSDSIQSPLQLHKFQTVHGVRGFVLVESRVGPYHYSQDRGERIFENDSENLRSIYGLVRQFKAANGDYNDKFGVLPCRGFYYDKRRRDSGILLIWNLPSPPPGQLPSSEEPPSLKTLLEELISPSEESPRLFAKVAKCLVRAVYELHLARWYHRSICLNNVIAVDNNWDKPYLVGFRTARFTDGHSDPVSRPLMDWKDRYFQHPDRYESIRPTTARFQMKHDIYSLGVLLLELQKGQHFGSAANATLGNCDGVALKKEFVKLAERKDVCLLGEAYIAPIVHCLSSFEKLDKGDDTTCHPRVLHAFRVKVMDPITKAGQVQGRRQQGMDIP
jgi:hypothetical protein